MYSNILGVILAGGQSRRMGIDKATLKINGVSMLQRNQHLLQSIGINDIVICRNQLGYLADIHPACGPMGAIHSALSYAQMHCEAQKHNPISALLIIPVDMPLLDNQLINHLIGNEQTLPQKKRCHARYYQDTPLPLFLPYHSSYVALSETVATSPKNRSIRAFLGLIDSDAIISEQPERLINTNNKEQWRQAVNTLLADKKE